jgi:hypothetical protein
MATKDYGQTYYTNPTGVPANVPVEMEKLAESLEGLTIVSFASTAAKDAAFATLTTDQKKGLVVHVQGKGWFGYDGSTWFQFGTLVMKSGRTSTVIESNGFARVPSADCFFDGAAPTRMIYQPTYFADTITTALFDGAGALARIWNAQTNTNPAVGQPVVFDWIAIK